MTQETYYFHTLSKLYSYEFCLKIHEVNRSFANDNNCIYDI